MLLLVAIIVEAAVVVEPPWPLLLLLKKNSLGKEDLVCRCVMVRCTRDNWRVRCSGILAVLSVPPPPSAVVG